MQANKTVKEAINAFMKTLSLEGVKLAGKEA